MQFLRRISSKQLALLCAAVLAVAGGGTALALAAASGGPVPPDKPLANAVHDALAAPQLDGVSARVSFTNKLLDGVDLRGSNPILGGADGRLWATKDGHFRLELQSSGGGGDAQIVSDGKSWWAYDGSSKTVYRGTIPQERGNERQHQYQVPTVSRIQKVLNRVMQHAAITGPQAGTTAGEPSYTVKASPRRNGGLLGALEFAWDANNGAPLRGAVYAKGDSSPVLQLEATDISFGPVDAGVFDVNPPAGAKAQNVAPHNGARGPERAGHGHRGSDVTGLAKVQKRVGFHVAAPASLSGRTRSTVALIGKGKGAVVTYGRGLSGIAVIQKSVQAGGDKSPLGRAELPTVSINGTSAQELSTPLGTVLRFKRGGVMYVVLGSAPRAVVEAAARGL